MIRKILALVIVAFILAVVIAVCAMFLVFRDIEHEKRVCGNCANRDDCLHYCWTRGWEVGTQTEACSLFVNKHKV